MSQTRLNIKTIEKTSKKIEEKARNYLKTGVGDASIAFQWLDYRIMMNMYRVCESFYHDRLHYGTSQDKHPFIGSARKDYLETSLSSLEAVLVETSPGMFSPIARAYRIKEGEDAAKTLKMLLSSYTTGDCTSSINITYLLTLYDVIQLLHGHHADQVFNRLFGSHRPLEERMMFGSFSSGLSLDKEETLTPQQYFGLRIGEICLPKVIKSPKDYTGVTFYIKNNPDYLKKHPGGRSQGWNAIFCGLNDKNEPLYLIARTPGEDFCLTHQELLTLLKDNYNKLPKFEEKSKIFDETDESKMQLNETGPYFNLSKLRELNDVEKVSESLHQFIENNKLKKRTTLELASIKNSEHVMMKSKDLIAERIKPATNLDDNTKIKYLKNPPGSVEKLVYSPHYSLMKKRKALSLIEISLPSKKMKTLGR